MEISICGKRKVSFKDNTSGEVITGVTYFYLSEDPNVDGYLPDKMFIRDGSYVSALFQVGHWYDVEYNKYGKINLQSVVECQHTN